MGSIIDERHILTANRCVQHTNHKTMKILLGYFKAYWGRHSYVYYVEKVLKHEHGLVLLRLTKNIQFSRRIRPIRLLREDEITEPKAKSKLASGEAAGESDKSAESGTPTSEVTQETSTTTSTTTTTVSSTARNENRTKDDNRNNKNQSEPVGNSTNIQMYSKTKSGDLGQQKGNRTENQNERDDDEEEEEEEEYEDEDEDYDDYEDYEEYEEEGKEEIEEKKEDHKSTDKVIDNSKIYTLSPQSQKLKRDSKSGFAKDVNVTNVNIKKESAKHVNVKNEKAKNVIVKNEKAKNVNIKNEKAKNVNVKIEKSKNETLKIGNAKKANTKIASAKNVNPKNGTLKNVKAKIGSAKNVNTSNENFKVKSAKVANVKNKNTKDEIAKKVNAKKGNVKEGNRKNEILVHRNAKEEIPKKGTVKKENIKYKNAVTFYTQTNNSETEPPKVENSTNATDANGTSETEKPVSNVDIVPIKLEAIPKFKDKHPKIEKILLVGFPLTIMDVVGDPIPQVLIYSMREEDVQDASDACVGLYRPPKINEDENYLTRDFCSPGSSKFCWGCLGGPTLYKRDEEYIQVGVVGGADCEKDNGTKLAQYIHFRVDIHMNWILTNSLIPQKL